MENTSRNPGKYSSEEEEENAVLYAIKTLESKGENIVSKRTNRGPDRTLILTIRRSRGGENCRDLFLHNIHGFYHNIPKHLTTCDEKYALRCLELIRNCALRAAVWNFTSKVDILSATIKNRSLNNMAIEYPLGRSGNWALGTVSGSPTMISILKSPLLLQFGKTNLFDAVQEPTSDSSCKLQRDVQVVNGNYLSAPLHKRDVSVSSSNSSFSDQSSSSSSHGTSFQGMLQCKWRDGLPHHVFTVDDKKEVYMAYLTDADSSTNKDLDYVYTFHVRRNGKKDDDANSLESETVGKMRVSTSITLASDNSEVRETQFVLSVSSDDRTVETITPNHALKKNKTLTRKVVDVFRSGSTHKRRSGSILEGSSGVFEDLNQSEDVRNNLLDLDEGNRGNIHPPTHELAAIVVKEISSNSKEVEVGGWGLKFLKKARNSAVLPSEHSRSTGECSTSMDIVIPAGFHGGPRTRVGGPSSLIERWVSGGLCDCGGWDIGCPLTILKARARSNGVDYSIGAENSRECKSIDLFVQGLKHNEPIMKMVNIHKGLYYIHFQSALSTLQSFAIAAALIHSRSPVLRSKVYRS